VNISGFPKAILCESRWGMCPLKTRQAAIITKRNEDLLTKKAGYYKLMPHVDPCGIFTKVYTKQDLVCRT